MYFSSTLLPKNVTKNEIHRKHDKHANMISAHISRHVSRHIAKITNEGLTFIRNYGKIPNRCVSTKMFKFVHLMPVAMKIDTIVIRGC